MRAHHDMTLETAQAWHQSGKGAALATVVQTWGSAPRPVGSLLAVSGDAEIAGSVSGGCVEAAVAAEAVDAIADGAARLMEFGVSDEDAFAVGLACGGTIRILVEPLGAGLSEQIVAKLVEARAARIPVGLEMVLPHRAEGAITPMPGIEHRVIGYGDAADRFDADTSGFDPQDDLRFTAVFTPPLRLAIVGGAHIAQPLCRMARDAGYDVSIIDPREAFASPARFPGERLVHEWPDAALEALGLDIRTAVVLLTHDPKLDDPALLVALPSPAFYVGALGSKRTHAKRRARLVEAGLSASEIDRIDAPIGLDIGARSPAEIAIAVLAEMTERLRRPGSRPGRAASDPVPEAGAAA